jgi:hypothetical protein
MIVYELVVGAQRCRLQGATIAQAVNHAHLNLDTMAAESGVPAVGWVLVLGRCRGAPDIEYSRIGPIVSDKEGTDANAGR